MSAEDLAELNNLGTHLVTRHEEARGVRAIDATIVDRIRSEQGTTIIAALITTKHPEASSDGTSVHQRACLAAVSPENRVTSFHIRAVNMAEIISALAKISVLIVLGSRKKRHTSDKPKVSEPSGDP